jgi:hypothetical protein
VINRMKFFKVDMILRSDFLLFEKVFNGKVGISAVIPERIVEIKKNVLHLHTAQS